MGASAAARIAQLAKSSFDPDAWVLALERLSPELGEDPPPELLKCLAEIVNGSDFLPRLIVSRPALLRPLRRTRSLSTEKTADQFRRGAQAATRGVPAGDARALCKALRRYKYRELVRLAARDLFRGAPMDVLGREASGLAVALIDAALRCCWRTLMDKHGSPSWTESTAAPATVARGFCVLGLGKLGGEDLNFSSDVDLIFAYEAEGTTAGGPSGPVSHREFFAKLAGALTHALSSLTEDGFCYRVDLNLRPLGRSGPIALSVPAMTNYYETRGQTWERSALVKARPIAGDLALGESFVRSIEAFLWRRNLDYAAVDELRQIRSQIQLRGRATNDDVKLGPGGIREVEFFVSALQLLHGGKNPVLRERNTLRALRRLEAAGLVSGADADRLAEGYAFLRRVENRLQMVEEAQTQTLPASSRDRERLAHSLDLGTWANFLERLGSHRAFVEHAFFRLLGETARDEVPDEPLLALALDRDASDEVRASALARRGFTSPDNALRAIDRLTRVRGSPFEIGIAGPGMVALRLFAEVARTPDPDQALQYFADFIGSLKAPHGYLSLLSQAPRARRRLFNLFGQSDFLSRYFLGHPELLDRLVQPDPLPGNRRPEEIRAELAARISRTADAEERLASLRRFKNEEVLRIGLEDIAGEIGVFQIASQLSALADGILDEALFLAESEQRERYGDPVSVDGLRRSLVVIGLGKLGGRELGYHSDLDLIFVYGGNGLEDTSGGIRGRQTHHEFFSRAVQRLISFLQLQLREGSLYRVDTRLRPSGSQGPLVVSQEAFRAHHVRAAELWERQALIKARGSAGDLSLFGELERDVIHPLVYERALPELAAGKIEAMRSRMEKEASRESGGFLDPKLGHGGLADVEFAVQFLQLRSSANGSGVRSPNTLEALALLAEGGHLSGTDATSLREGYLFLRRVENRLRLIHGESIARLPTQGRPLAVLARRLGYEGTRAGEQFLEDYRSIAGRVREVYQRILRATRDERV